MGSATDVGVLDSRLAMWSTVIFLAPTIVGASVRTQLIPRIVSRTDARLLGFTRFFTGRLCKYGHVCQRLTSNGGCVECHNARSLVSRALRRVNVDDIREMLLVCGDVCPVCWVNIKTTYTLDHKTPIAQGGSDDISNIQLLCKQCNISKGQRTMEEWVMTRSHLRRLAMRPTPSVVPALPQLRKKADTAPAPALKRPRRKSKVIRSSTEWFGRRHYSH